MDNNILNNKIAELRKASGLTQDALAAKLGISYQAISKWENGLSCPDVLLIPQIAEIFSVSIDELFGLSQPSATASDPLPWPDDTTIHIAAFKGHSLLREKALNKEFPDEALCLHWEGDVENLSCNMNIEIHGDVRGDVNAAMSVSCNDVAGSVNAGGGVNCCDVSGNVFAEGGVCCCDVCGSIYAGGSVSFKKNGEKDKHFHFSANGREIDMEKIEDIKKSAAEIEQNAV